MGVVSPSERDDDQSVPPAAPEVSGHIGNARPTDPDTATTEPPREVLTVLELAALLRVERKTAYNLVNAGEIPGARRIGRSIRIHRAAVLKWLSEGQGRPPRSRRSR